MIITSICLFRIYQHFFKVLVVEKKPENIENHRIAESSYNIEVNRKLLHLNKTNKLPLTCSSRSRVVHQQNSDHASGSMLT